MDNTTTFPWTAPPSEKHNTPLVLAGQDERERAMPFIQHELLAELSEFFATMMRNMDYTLPNNNPELAACIIRVQYLQQLIGE